jgi:hypothetical protein
MCVEIEREDQDSVLVTITGLVGVMVDKPLEGFYEDDKMQTLATDRVQLSLDDEAFTDLVVQIRKYVKSEA